MTLGPLEFVMVAFEGNRFSGQILSELRAAQEKGIIRVIDLLVIKKKMSRAALWRGKRAGNGTSSASYSTSAHALEVVEEADVWVGSL
jgi:hypothetical protein